MSKIKFSKEWYRDNDIVINCRTEEEANKFIEELAKVEVTEWGSNNELKLNSKFNSYKSETCYRLEQDYTVTYCGINFFEKEDYSIIKFSDLEFESKALINSRTVDKLEPSVETNTPIKRTILRESVELKNGDVFEIIYSNVKSIGIVIDDHVLYNDGTWDGLDITKNITWIIYGEDIKSMSIGHEISQLLFKNKLDDELEDFITYLIDKPKEPVKKTVEVFTVRFCKTESGMSHYISDSEEIFVEDIVSPIRGEYEDLYGEVINIQYKELSEEELKSYNKVTKIK